MTHLMLKWPETNKAAADAYKAQADVELRVISGVPTDIWGEVAADRHGNWVMPMLAPPYIFDVEVIEEPASLVPLRAEAVIVTDPEWPDP